MTNAQTYKKYNERKYDKVQYNIRITYKKYTIQYTSTKNYRSPVRGLGLYWDDYTGEPWTAVLLPMSVSRSRCSNAQRDHWPPASAASSVSVSYQPVHCINECSSLEMRASLFLNLALVIITFTSARGTFNPSLLILDSKRFQLVLCVAVFMKLTFCRNSQL